MKRNLIFSILMMSAFALFAQQEPQYTHYAFNRLAYNPAIAGSMGNGVLAALYRNQWSGIDGAPRTAIVSGHMPVFGNRAGMGLTLTNDQIGMTTSNFGVLSYAYRIPVTERAVLSIGLQGEVEYSSFDWSKANLAQKTDQLAGSQAASKIGANAGTGIYLKTPRYYVGFSVPRLFKNTLYKSINNQNKTNRDFRSYYVSAGATFPLSTNVSFIPMTMVSFGPSVPTSFDLGANFLFMKKFGIGANWRALDSFDGLIQMQLTNRLKAGFAYDFTTSALKKATNGSWEAMLEYQFKCKDKDLVNSIRYF